MPPACCAPVQEALPLLRRDRRWQMYDREPIPSWVDGCLALLSDAAHPTRQYLAQGAASPCKTASRCPTRSRVRLTCRPGLLAMPTPARPCCPVQETARIWGEIRRVDGVARLLRNELLRSLPAGHVHYVDWLCAPPRDGVWSAQQM